MHFETYVKQIIERAPDVRSFRFNKPEGLNCFAGQDMIATLKSERKEPREPFTISSSPTEQDYLEMIKKLTVHPFSNALAS